MGIWSIGIWLAASLSVGAALPNHDLLPIVDDDIETVEETSQSIGIGPVTESIMSPVEEAATPVVDALDAISEPLDPVVDPLLDQLAGTVDDVTDPITVPGEPEPSEPVGGSPVSGSSSDASSDPAAGTSVSPSLPGPDRPLSDDLFVEPPPGRASGAEPDLVSSIEGVTVVDDGARLAALAEAARMRVAVSAPLVPGSALESILAWLADGPGFAGILAAPLELIAVLVRALISAGSGLVAPVTLLSALVVRRLWATRRDPTAT